MKRGMTIKYLKCRADAASFNFEVQVEVDFGVGLNGATPQVSLKKSFNLIYLKFSLRSLSYPLIFSQAHHTVVIETMVDYVMYQMTKCNI